MLKLDSTQRLGPWHAHWTHWRKKEYGNEEKENNMVWGSRVACGLAFSASALWPSRIRTGSSATWGAATLSSSSWGSDGDEGEDWPKEPCPQRPFSAPVPPQREGDSVVLSTPGTYYYMEEVYLISGKVQWMEEASFAIQWYLDRNLNLGSRFPLPSWTANAVGQVIWPCTGLGCWVNCWIREVLWACQKKGIMKIKHYCSP